MLNIGYACQLVGFPDTVFRTCVARNATPDVLAGLIDHNLQLLERILDFNRANGLRLYRISSDLIPFGSSPVNPLAWWELFAPRLTRIGAQLRASGQRVSLHPGQYTVLNSPDPDVVRRAVADLAYHQRVLDSLGAGDESKIILHVGGAYGDKEAALARFRQVWATLDGAVRRRVVLENDDRCFTIADVLDLGRDLGLPVVFDNLHHALNPPVTALAGKRSDVDWIAACRPTWQPADGRQKIHYSQQDPAKSGGSHAQTIAPGPFLDFCHRLERDDLDIMLEVKDKNLSARKCQLCCPAAGLAARAVAAALEQEWHHYKYTVLERSPADYLAIRELLKHKTDAPALTFYEQIGQALNTAVVDPGQAENAALHVWGYFKAAAAESERSRFFRLLADFRGGAVTIKPIKALLWQLTVKYQQKYLLDSYYFAL